MLFRSPIVAEDKESLLAGLQQLTPLSRYRRFFSPIHTLSTTMLAQLTELDYHDRFAWVALALDAPGGRGVGVARYARCTTDPHVAEVAIAVADDHHRRGIGTLLLEVLALTAREHGIERLTALVLADNEPMTTLLRDHGASLHMEASAGAWRAEVPVPADPSDMRNTALYRLLRLAARGQIGQWTRPADD